jgi:hypothetical protein
VTEEHEVSEEFRKEQIEPEEGGPLSAAVTISERSPLAQTADGSVGGRAESNARHHGDATDASLTRESAHVPQLGAPPSKKDCSLSPGAVCASSAPSTAAGLCPPS